MAKFIVADKFLLVLHEAGLLGDDYESTKRVIIDLEVGSIARIYKVQFADDDSVMHVLDAFASGELVSENSRDGLATGRNLPISRKSSDEAKVTA